MFKWSLPSCIKALIPSPPQTHLLLSDSSPTALSPNSSPSPSAPATRHPSPFLHPLLALFTPSPLCSLLAIFPLYSQSKYMVSTPNLTISSPPLPRWCSMCWVPPGLFLCFSFQTRAQHGTGGAHEGIHECSGFLPVSQRYARGLLISSCQSSRERYNLGRVGGNVGRNKRDSRRFC